MEASVEEREKGIFIPRELLDKLEIEEPNILIRGQEIVIRPKSVARKLRGVVKTRLSMDELEELYRPNRICNEDCDQRRNHCVVCLS
jgi:hypothetical protein